MATSYGLFQIGCRGLLLIQAVSGFKNFVPPAKHGVTSPRGKGAFGGQCPNQSWAKMFGGLLVADTLSSEQVKVLSKRVVYGEEHFSG